MQARPSNDRGYPALAVKQRRASSRVSRASGINCWNTDTDGRDGHRLGTLHRQEGRRMLRMKRMHRIGSAAGQTPRTTSRDEFFVTPAGFDNRVRLSR
jgi:hypothetical protein